MFNSCLQGKCEKCHHCRDCVELLVGYSHMSEARNVITRILIPHIPSQHVFMHQRPLITPIMVGLHTSKLVRGLRSTATFYHFV